MNIVERMSEVWREAANELSFKFVSPFSFAEGARAIHCFGCLPEFGSSQGMVVFTEFNAEHCRLAQVHGYGYSCLSPSEEPFEREVFVAILNDWGWSDSSRAPPSWYTGEPWSS